MELKRAFGGAFAGRRVLVTGHTGFKGSWLCLWLEALGAEVSALALPPDTQPSHWQQLALTTVREHLVDLRDAQAVGAVFDAVQPEVVFHLAAQPLVRRSYREPVETFATNVGGLINVHEAMRRCGSVRAFVNATTDKVYRQRTGVSGGYREGEPLGGHDPYSTSKACAELVTECWRKSFHADGPRCATARAGNVIGGGDWAEDRLVPDFVRAAVARQPLAIRNPSALRPWQHVLEPLAGYLVLAQGLLAGREVEAPWNFGPGDDANLSVGDLAERLHAHWPGIAIVASPGPHPHEAQWLALDCGHARRELGWRPVWDAATAIERTVGWYRAFHVEGNLLSRQDLARYVADARAAAVAWAT